MTTASSLHHLLEVDYHDEEEWSVVLTLGKLVVTSHTSPILVFPRIQPFGSDNFSSLGKVYSRHATASVNCENSSVSFVTKYCPTSTVVRNPATVQNLITRFCCDSLSTRSWYICNRSSCAGSSVEGVGVFVNKLLAQTMGQIVLPVQVSLFLHGKLCILHTNLRLAP